MKGLRESAASETNCSQEKPQAVSSFIQARKRRASEIIQAGLL